MNFKEFKDRHNIDKIVWVDDSNSDMSKRTVEDLAKLFLIALERKGKLLRGRLQSKLKSVEGVDIGKVRRLFRKAEDGFDIEDEELVGLCFEENLRENLENCLSYLNGDEQESKDSVFDAYLHVCCDYEKIGFSEFNECREMVLSREKSTLLILDLVNIKEIGVPYNAGEEILKQNFEMEKLVIVVLTNECSSDQEVGYARQLILDKELRKTKPLYVISKDRGSVDCKQELAKHFETVWHRISLMESYSGLMLGIENAYREAVNDTLEKLKYFTLEGLVFNAAHSYQEEGTPEYESILRIINTLCDKYFQKQLLDNKKLLNSLKDSRSLVCEMEERKDVEDAEINDFLVSERFENIRTMNKTKAAVSIGDIFECYKKGCENSEYYIVIGNLCHSLLRGKGSRRNGNALLFPVTACEPGHDLKCNLGGLVNDLTEITFDSDPTAEWWVDFTQPWSVSYYYLDLVWTNNDGVASFTFSEKSVEKLMDEGLLTKSQKNRILEMKNIALNMNGESGVIQKKLERPKGYSLRRVARLSMSESLAAVNQYATSIGQLPRPPKLV